VASAPIRRAQRVRGVRSPPYSRCLFPRPVVGRGGLRRPRRATESPLYRLAETHLEELLRVWPERFQKLHGGLRPVVERVLRGFLECGIVSHGFARDWCERCRLSYLSPYSCRGRSFCPSCEKKRSILWAEWLREEVLEPVPHRHVVFTIPRLLRGIFRNAESCCSMSRNAVRRH